MKKKKGFTLIELMAVIAIIAILAAVLVPTVSGYITRSKKTAIITQVRNAVGAMETFNITAPNETDKYTLTNNENVEIGDLPSLIGSDLLEINAIKNIEEMTVKEAFMINSDPNSLNKIVLDGNDFADLATTVQ
ncbi:MAG: type II secretion system protein [Clostridium saudiense]|nr:prepilin-type N-terminal cleavage/methylation domain-containing protein [Clostridium saudiense]